MSLKRNSIWNLAGAGLPLLIGAIAIPYLVQRLGVERFGILSLVWSLIGYFSLFDFGMGRALTQQLAKRIGTPMQDEIPQLAKAGMVFIGATGGVGALLLAGLSGPLSADWLNISLGLQQETASSLLIAALGIPFTTAATGLRGVSEAYGDFKAVSLLRMALGAGTFALPVICVWVAGPSLPIIVTALAGARAVACVAQLWLAGRCLPNRWWRATRQPGYLRQLLAQGAWMTASNIIGPVIVSMDRFVIAAVAGASVVAYYSVPAEMMLRLLIVPGALTTALFPQLTTVLASSRPEAVYLYHRSIRALILILAPVCLVMAVFSYPALAWWINPLFAAQAWPVVAILSLGILCNGLAFVPFTAIQAAGSARVTGTINIAMLLVYIPIVFIFVSWMGIVGAAIAWLIRAALDALLLFWAARKILHMAV